MRRARVATLMALAASLFAAAARAEPALAVADSPEAREAAAEGIEREQAASLAFTRPRVFVFADAAYMAALVPVSLKDVQGSSNLQSFTSTSLSTSGPGGNLGIGFHFHIGSIQAQARIAAGAMSTSFTDTKSGTCQNGTATGSCSVLFSGGGASPFVWADVTLRSSFGATSPFFFGGGIGGGVLLAKYHVDSGNMSTFSGGVTATVPLYGVVGEIGASFGDGPGGLELPVRVIVTPNGGGAMLSPAWVF